MKNKAEEFVAELSKRSFLALWTYPNPRGKAPQELCDLLVVCHPDVIVVSVKEVQFKDTGRPEVDLKRWHKRAVETSVKQVYGAERRLELVTEVTTSEGESGLSLPDKSIRRVHRVAVALGGEGKVSLSSRYFKGGYVHILDGPAFGTIVQELDTITDFVDYLRAKESLEGRLRIEGGEEDLLAFYLQNGRAFPTDRDVICVGAGLWRVLRNSPEYQAKKQADRPSYAWDEIIDSFGRDQLDGKLLGGRRLDEVEEALRVMAREDRFSRRGLGKAFTGFLEANRKGIARARMNAGHGLATYVFLGCPLATPRDQRAKELELRCLVARGLHPENDTVVGIATETPRGTPGFSLDLAYLCIPEWTEEHQTCVARLQKNLGYFVSMKTHEAHEEEYPRQ